MQKSLSLLVSLLLCSCIQTIPQDREQFKEVVAKKKGAAQKETIQVDRRFGSVYTQLRQNTGSCLDVLYQRTEQTANDTEYSFINFTPTLKQTASGVAEFALQIDHWPPISGPAQPPGGRFLMAADLTAEGNGTRIDIYAPTIGFDPIVEAFKAWLRGENATCPRLYQ